MFLEFSLYLKRKAVKTKSMTTGNVTFTKQVDSSGSVI